MKRSFTLLLIILVFASNVIGAVTVVSGKVDGGKGLVIRLMTHSDRVSYLRETLSSCVIDDSGNFQLQTNLDETLHTWLDIEFSQGDIYLQPGMNYEVLILLEQSTLSYSYYDRPALPVSFIQDDPDRLNLYIRDFNGIYNDFILNYMSGRNNQNNAQSFQAFKTAVDLRFKNASNHYFRDYVRYKTASMEMFLRLKNRDKLGLECLSNQPVLFQNIEYMEFFHLFFEKYFLTGNKFFSYNKTYDLINGNASLETILDSLSKDPVLEGDELKQLLLLSGLKELYGNSGFDRQRIGSLLDELAESGCSESIKEIASNLETRFSRLKSGSPAPAFDLPAFDYKDEFKLSDFKGRWIYLVFFDSRNPACQAEMRMVSEWYEEVAGKVSFVAISVDQEPAAISGNPNILPEAWTILFYDNNMDLLESYDALTFPYFILIDKEGLIKSCPALSPSENIREVLNAL